MRNLAVFRTMVVLLFVAVPGLCWGANALIVHDGTAGDEAAALANLTTHLTGKGFTVTPNVGVPAGSLAPYQQIWDIRFNNTTPLTASDMTAYAAYLAGGGSLFLMGENTAFLTRDNSIVSFVQLVGGGTINIVSPANAQTVLPPFTGPTPVTNITFLAGAGSVMFPGTGQLITRDVNNLGTAIVFVPGRLANAPMGTLIIVFDVNFLETGADANSQAFTDNLISFLAAPPALANTAPVSTLSEWGIILLAVLMVASAALAFRRRLRPLS